MRQPQANRYAYITDRPSKFAVPKLVAKGKSNAEIAAELCLTAPTVKTYESSPYQAGLERPRAAAVLAYEGGLVQVREA
jgi:DNA-binding NarL/FixJ family response regulator